MHAILPLINRPKKPKKMPFKCFLPRLAKRVIVKVHKISALYRYILLTLAHLVNNKLSLVESWKPLKWNNYWRFAWHVVVKCCSTFGSSNVAVCVDTLYNPPGKKHQKRNESKISKLILWLPFTLLSYLQPGDHLSFAGSGRVMARSNPSQYFWEGSL